jgi:hypothetical protein
MAALLVLVRLVKRTTSPLQAAYHFAGIVALFLAIGFALDSRLGI